MKHSAEEVIQDLLKGTKLNIHPNAFSCSAADVNEIIFVYRGGLSTGPL